MHQKECNQFVKFVCHQNASHFYGLPLDLCGTCGTQYSGVFFWPNAPQFGKIHRIFIGKAPQSLEKHRNPWKSTAILDCGNLQDSTLSGSAAHTERQARRTVCRANQCRGGTFVAFFLTRNVRKNTGGFMFF